MPRIDDGVAVAYFVLAVVSVEAMIGLAATYLARILGRKPRFLPRFLSGLVLGMGWSPFLHGLLFGGLFFLFRAEGPGATRDVGLLAGYGVVAAVLPGLPLGIVIGLVIGFVGWWRGR